MTNSADEIFYTGNLYMRKFKLSDVDDMLKNWISDKDVQFEYGEPVFTEKIDVEKLLSKWLTEYRWAIVHKETNENIGHVSFCRLYEDVNTGEIEYCIAKKHWGQGFATEAVKGFIDYTFGNTGIVKIEAFHRIENPASGRVLQKAGMAKVGNVLRFSDRESAPEGNVCYAVERCQ